MTAYGIIEVFDDIVRDMIGNSEEDNGNFEDIEAQEDESHEGASSRGDDEYDEEEDLMEEEESKLGAGHNGMVPSKRKANK